MGVSQKPLLFLDVDGVLNACPPLPGEPVIKMKGFPICIPPGTKERIARLLEVFEPVWATTWRDDAHPHFHEPLELGEAAWPHINFHTFKLLSIIEYAFEQRMSGYVALPWLWIDDDAEWEMRELGIRHDEKRTLCLAPETARGLTDEHVEQALNFAEKLA